MKKLKTALATIVAVFIAVVTLRYAHDRFFSTAYTSAHYRKVDKMIQTYADAKFGAGNIAYEGTSWNKHGFFTAGCVFYGQATHVESGLKFVILATGRKIIGDTYNKEGWARKLNAEFEAQAKQVFGEDALVTFTFTFDFENSGAAIDDFTDVAAFNQSLNRGLELKFERNDELLLSIYPRACYDAEIDPARIDAMRRLLDNSGVDYGRARFVYWDAYVVSIEVYDCELLPFFGQNPSSRSFA